MLRSHELPALKRREVRRRPSWRRYTAASLRSSFPSRWGGDGSPLCSKGIIGYRTRRVAARWIGQAGAHLHAEGGN